MRQLALYARVSTTDQHPEVQLQALRSYATARGLAVVEEYVDHGVSGARAQRPALDRLQADALRRRFDGVVVVRLDRLARSVRHLTNLVADLESLALPEPGQLLMLGSGFAFLLGLGHSRIRS